MNIQRKNLWIHQFSIHRNLPEPFRLIITGMTPKQKGASLKFITGMKLFLSMVLPVLENGRIKVSFVEPNPDVMDGNIWNIWCFADVFNLFKSFTQKDSIIRKY